MVVEYAGGLNILWDPKWELKLVQKGVKRVTPGATIIPIIILSNKTQVTLFRNKTAYPVYLTIGNLPKLICCKPSRQSQILLVYLPISRLLHISNKATRWRTQANLLHACMNFILSLLKVSGVQGIEMAGGDGIVCWGHPILACYVNDYPKQCLATSAFLGDCPECNCPNKELGVYPCPHALRNFNTYVDIFRSITPDILHQLHQGVVKHLIDWLRAACDDSFINERVQWLPPNHSIRIFTKGITLLLGVSGTEHRQISSFLLGVLIDVQLPEQFSTFFTWLNILFTLTKHFLLSKILLNIFTTINTFLRSSGFEMILIFPSFTFLSTIIAQSSFSGQRITTIRRPLSIFISTLQRMLIKQPITKMSLNFVQMTKWLEC